MSSHFYFEIETDSRVGNMVQLVGDGPILNLTVECPWAGDTETGFGRDVTVRLQRIHVEKLRDSLTGWLKESA